MENPSFPYESLAGITSRNLRMLSSLYVGIKVHTSFVLLAANALLAFIGIFSGMLEHVVIGCRRIEMPCGGNEPPGKLIKCPPALWPNGLLSFTRPGSSDPLGERLS